MKETGAPAVLIEDDRQVYGVIVSSRLDCPRGIAMDSFPGALGQVIANLVNNAVIHAYDRGDAGAIEVRGAMRGGMVNICVIDAGRGIPSEIQAKIYDPFFTTRRGSGGSGLGLHIVFNLVTECLKGDIRCDSTIGEGARFTLSIPRIVPPSLG